MFRKQGLELDLALFELDIRTHNCKWSGWLAGRRTFCGNPTSKRDLIVGNLNISECRYPFRTHYWLLLKRATPRRRIGFDTRL